jgi:hypothetical protein
LQSLGINLNFLDLTIEWDGASTSMKNIANSYDDWKSIEAYEDTFMPNRIKSIIDAKYEKANLKMTAEASERFERRQLLKILMKHERLFQGKLGRWKNTKCKIKLKPGVTTYHARAYPVPKSREAQLRLEVDRLCKEGVLKKVNRSEWAAPTFAIPKKDGSIHFISDFRELNARIKRTPFPIPKIQDLMLKLEGFQYATSLDLNMGYYHIELSADSKAYCMIVLPWGKYEYRVYRTAPIYSKRKCPN